MYRALVLLCVLILSLSGCKKNDPSAGGSASPSPEPQSQTVTPESFPTPEVADTVAVRPDHPNGDMLITASIGEPLNLIPAIAPDSASHDVARLIYEGLVDVDKDLNIIGKLAESWDISEDNLTITFHLRKGVKWHDGQPFTAKDVIFTYNFMLDENTPTPYDEKFRMVSAIEATDEYTVVVKYEKPYAPALLSWSMWVMPAHLLEGVSVTKSALQRNPVGTGPYRLESWEPNQTLTLRANPDYFEGRPRIERYRFRYLQDQSTTFMELLQGGVDTAMLTPAQFARQTDTDRFRQMYNKLEYLSPSYSYVGYNLTRAPFDDKRVRQALSYATPKQQIIDSVMQGYATPTTGPYLPDSFWYNGNVPKYDYDLQQAQRLLAEAGWIKNDKGVLMKDNKPFKMELLTNQNTTRSQIAEILQNSWKELGIDVTIRVAEWGAFLNQHVDKRNFDAIILSWNIVLDPNPNDVWHSKSCTDKSTLNFVCFQNEEVDGLIEAGVATFDQDRRKAHYDRFQEILAEEQPYTFLFVPQALVAMSSRIKGVEPAPAGILYNLIDWYVPEAEQKYRFQD